MKGTPRHCKLTQSGTFETLHWLGRRPLNGHSIQDALRAFFQPIKSDDARVNFYATYKKEATEYDTDYVKKYDGDLNTTLIFVRRLPFAPTIISPTVVGWSVLCCQFSLRHRHPLKAQA